MLLSKNMKRKFKKMMFSIPQQPKGNGNISSNTLLGMRLHIRGTVNKVIHDSKKGHKGPFYGETCL